MGVKTGFAQGFGRIVVGYSLAQEHQIVGVDHWRFHEGVVRIAPVYSIS